MVACPCLGAQLVGGGLTKKVLRQNQNGAAKPLLTRHGHVHEWRPAVVQLSEEELETALKARPVA